MEEDDKEKYKVDEQNKIYIVGGRGVGKTTFLYQIHYGEFNNSLSPSEIGIGISQYKKGRNAFTIKDLTDDDNFSKTKYLKNELEDVILIFVLFALNDKDSFEYAKNLIQFIKNSLINNEEMEIILLGNKLDLVENSPKGNIVEKNEVDQYISKIEKIRYYEISCKTSHNIPIIKGMIDGIEIEEETDEEDDKINEEERKKKVNEVKAKSCLFC